MSDAVTSTTPVDNVVTLGEAINTYGFLIIFAAVMLIVILGFFITYTKRIEKKDKVELDILDKERTASINQNQEMFNLVTNVQTEQIGQLREMTTVLKSLSDTTREVAGVSSDVKDIKVSSANTEKNSEIILNTLADILEYVRRTEKCNHVILEKVNLLEKSLMLSERNDQTND
jgi:hypothetical protein